MESYRHLIFSLILAGLCFALGTVGYMLIEHWDLLDAIYMTAITLSTVGYSEVNEMSPAGRLFTIVLVVVGVGFTLYIAGAFVQFMVEGRVRSILGRKRLNHRIKHLQNHYIVCGYGRIGRVLCQDLLGEPFDFVVIENNPDLVPVMEADRILHISGDATDESILTAVNIKQARGLVAVLATDTNNVFLVLTARQLNPSLFIVARSGSQHAKSKLELAGADRVESPYAIGAARMAQRILRPTVTSFLDLAFAHQRKDIQMEEIPINAASSLVNVMLKDSGIRQRFNLIIIAMLKVDGSMHFNPSFEAVLCSGDTVIAVGEADNLSQLERILNPAQS